MKKYDIYKDSEIKWLDDIPKHWRACRLKDIAYIVRGGSPRPAGDPRYYGGDIPFLRVADLTAKEGVYLDKFRFTITRLGLLNTRLVKPNTLLLTNSGATLGIPKIISFSATFNDGVAAFLNIKNCDKVFLFYFLKNRTKWFLNMASLGQGQPNLNTEIIGNTFIALPLKNEQIIIADYLNKKTTAIDKRISLLETKIEYYKELYKSITSEAICKGLNKGVQLKDSGIEWIGEIPKHWEIKRIKDKFYTIAGGTPSTKEMKFWNGNIPWIPSGKVQNNQILFSEVEDFISEEALRNSSTKMAKANSVLIALTGATCSNIGHLTFNTTINQSIVAIYPKRKNINQRFLFHYLIAAKEKIRTYMTGGAQGGINQEDVRFLQVLVPPIEEQGAIAEHLDKKTTIIDAIVANIKLQIDSLKELRKTLINDVVTGKLKVTNKA